MMHHATKELFGLHFTSEVRVYPRNTENSKSRKPYLVDFCRVPLKDGVKSGLPKEFNVFRLLKLGVIHAREVILNEGNRVLNPLGNVFDRICMSCARFPLEKESRY